MILVYAILIGLASYRLWRIPARDIISEPFQNWLARKEDTGGTGWYYLASLVFCPWCLGWWIAGALSFVFFGWSLDLLLVWPAASTIAGATKTLLDD